MKGNSKHGLPPIFVHYVLHCRHSQEDAHHAETEDDNVEEPIYMELVHSLQHHVKKVGGYSSDH